MTLHGDKIDFLKYYNKSDQDHNRIINACQQVLEGLKKLHSLGYVHCDIKPQNILFDPPENEEKETMHSDTSLKSNFILIDFGICTSYLDESGNHIQ